MLIDLTLVTDPAQVQEIENSIAEGALILRAGTNHGRKLSTAELWAIRKAICNAEFRLGRSKLFVADEAIMDVTPAGYGPTC